MTKLLSALTVAAALFGVASSLTPAQARTIDGEGWRLVNGNWNSTCFRTLDYLSSSSACSD